MPPSLTAPAVPYLWAKELLDCACEALTNHTTGGCPDRACVYNGDTAVAYDNCCDGQLWVSWDRTIPSDWKTQSFGNFPTRSPRATKANCFQLIAIEFEIGIIRCAPTVHDDGTPPTCEEIEESALQMHEDAWAILKGVLCCLNEFSAAGFYTSWEQQEPTGDVGGCTGSVLRVAVGHELCPCVNT